MKECVSKGLRHLLEEITVLRSAEADDGTLLELSGGLDLDFIDIDSVGGALILDVPYERGL